MTRRFAAAALTIAIASGAVISSSRESSSQAVSCLVTDDEWRCPRHRPWTVMCVSGNPVRGAAARRPALETATARDALGARDAECDRWAALSKCQSAGHLDHRWN